MSNAVYANNGKPVDYDKLRADYEKRGLGLVNAAACDINDFAEQLEMIPVDTPSLVNRDTNEKNLKKILESMNGFDGRVWNPPRVARDRSTGKMYIFDGDHSRHLYCIFHPDADTMVARVIEVDSVEDVHNLFVQANCKGRTPITAEQIFVHTFLGGDQDAARIAACLSLAGLLVYCSAEEGGTAGDLNGYSIKINGFKRIVKLLTHRSTGMSESQAMKVLQTAVELVGKELTEYSSWSRKENIPVELLGAVAFVFATYPDIMPPAGSSHSIFKSYLRNKLANYEKMKHAINALKDTGGNITNYAEFSIARGIVKELNASVGKPGFMPRRLNPGKLKQYSLSSAR